LADFAACCVIRVPAASGVTRIAIGRPPLID
jgi:hypothetical protein